MGNTDPAAIPTVLLLGSQQDHEDNHGLLQGKDCSPLGVRRAEDLDNLLTADVCGIVIAKSWWTLLSPADHHAFLTKICRYSSFAWIKIDVTGLACGEELPEGAPQIEGRTFLAVLEEIGGRLQDGDSWLAVLRGLLVALLHRPVGAYFAPDDVWPGPFAVARICYRLLARTWRGQLGTVFTKQFNQSA